jgi:hypothetical protein
MVSAMFANGFLYCDLCQKEIPKGERYSTITVLKKHIAHDELSPEEQGLLVDSEGNLQLDVCLRCRKNMPLAGKEATA